jgi:hypothetical protein
VEITFANITANAPVVEIVVALKFVSTAGSARIAKNVAAVKYVNIIAFVQRAKNARAVKSANTIKSVRSAKIATDQGYANTAGNATSVRIAAAARFVNIIVNAKTAKNAAVPHSVSIIVGATIAQSVILNKPIKNTKGMRSGEVSRFPLRLNSFFSIVSLPCAFCGENIQPRGIDRWDNSVGYESENSRPCCSPCNFFKSDKDGPTFVEHFRRMADHTRAVENADDLAAFEAAQQ